jgi:hypothetical protein
VIYALTTSNRLLIADVLETLDDGRWDAATLCAGWTVRHLAAHFVQPMLVGPMGPFADTCIHLRDIARPLGLPADVPTEHWRILMDYLTSAKVAPALVPPGRLDGLELIATDTDWRGGAGATVTGPIEALGMAACGRPAALTDLHGPGRARLAARLGS